MYEKGPISLNSNLTIVENNSRNCCGYCLAMYTYVVPELNSIIIIKIKSNIFDNTKKQNKQTDENEKITAKCMKKNSKTTTC